MSILVCVSGMPYAAATVRMGDLVARLRNSPVMLFTMIRSEGERPLAETMLHEVETSLSAPVVDKVVRLGSPATGILQESSIGEHDMIVVGAHVEAGFWDHFARSIPHRISRRADASVLIVHEKAAALQRVLICTGDGRRGGRSVIKAGARLAKAANAEVGLLYVTDPVPAMYAGLADMDETLPELLQSNTPLAKHLRWGSRYLVKKGVTGRLKLRQGVVADEILLEASEGHYDLVVIGARLEDSIINSLLIGSVTPHVVDRAPCSVLVVRTEL
ncbi:MAG: universal stress protein [Anaerolineales bacterium]|nr:universal stress protein [Anaerolineales bacterium]